MIRFAICDDFAEDREFVRKVLTAYFYKRNERIEITEYEEGTVLDVYKRQVWETTHRAIMSCIQIATQS